MPLSFERLEPRQLFAAWQNDDLACDVDASALVTTDDALVVLQDISRNASRRLEPEKVDPADPFLDVNGDNYLWPLDALLILNAIARHPTPPTVAASIDRIDDPNASGVVLDDEIRLGCRSVPGSRVRVFVDREGDAAPRVAWQGVTDADGAFAPVVPVVRGANRLTIEVRNELGQKGQMVKLVNRGDVVADWNATLLNAVRDWTTTSNDPVPNRIVNSRPAEVTKNLAMVHAAMFDAINAVEGKYRSYLADLPSDPLASPITALATAAHRVSIHLYPDANQVAVLDATLAASLASVPEGTAKQRGVLLGEAIARRMIEAREGDGSSAPSTYTPSGEIGRWGRTGPGFLPPELPMWGQVKPFVLEDVTGVRVAAPPALDSAEYAAAVDQVMRVGRVDSTARTIEQTEIANFWADGAGTATPPGHWNRIASDVLMSRSPELIDSARTMAMLNLALADAAIAAWDVKYLYDFWRPIDVINQAAADGNDATVQDASWTPLLRTPPHPTYVSGHSTFSAAAATVLTHLLGDNVSFTTTNDPKTGLTQTPIPVQSLVTRRFANFAEAADEAGVSRVYGGIHFPFDNTAGQALGRAVGEAIVNSQL